MDRKHHGPFVRRAPLLVLLLIVAPCYAWAQGECVDGTEVNGFKVRSIKLRTLFNRIPQALRQKLDAHRSEAYSFDSATKYFAEINQFYANDAAQEKFERLIARKLRLSVKAGTTWLECLKKVDPADCQRAFPGEQQCVDVTLKRYFVDVDAIDSSPYLLLFPRSALAAFYGAMPRPLLALNPNLDSQHDKRFGPALSVDTVTDLLDLKSILEGAESAPPASATVPAAPTSPTPQSTDEEVTIVVSPAAKVVASANEPPANPREQNSKLLLRLTGEKSLNKDFYDTSVGLTAARTRSSGLFQELALEATFAANHLPRGNGEFLANAANVGLSTMIHPKDSFITLANIGGKYHWSRNRFASGDPTIPFEVASENGFEARALVDGNIGGGLARMGVWIERETLNNRRGTYGRFAALFAYAKEFVLPRKRDFHLISPPELTENQRPCWSSYSEPKNPKDKIRNPQTIGLELMAGGGRVWGDIPEYARFYAGTPSGQFLYDELQAQNMTRFPQGPILRSLPHSQGGVASVATNRPRGAASYWHANVNVSIPISAWSRPLIPHEWVTASRSQKTREDKEFEDYFAAHGISPDARICRDLKSTVKTLVKVSGVNLLVNQQARDKLTDAQKEALRLRNKPNRTIEEQQQLDDAERALLQIKTNLRPQIEEMFAQDIIPVTDFIADHANIIAVKPLVAFDVARLTRPNSQNQLTRYGFGGGLQIDIVLARFEFGYIAGLKRLDGDPRGNFFGRLILKRLF